MKSACESCRAELAAIREAGTYKDERIITTPQKSRIDTTQASAVVNLRVHSMLNRQISRVHNNNTAKEEHTMKKYAALFAAFMLIFALTGCGAETQTPAPNQGGQEELIPDSATSPDLVLDVVSYMKSVSASDFKEPKEYGTVSDQALADALNGAVKNVMSSDDIPSLFVDQWDIRWVFLEGSPTGATNKDLHLSISCGLKENVVEVVARKGQQEKSAYFEDAVLYQLVRHSSDYEESIDADAYEQVKEELTTKMVSTVEQMKENPLEATGYELTQLEKILDFTADEFETLKLYRYRYAITVAHPERDGWAGGMYLDSELRVQDGYRWAGYVALLENSGSGAVEKLWYDSDYCFDDGDMETDASDFEEQLHRWAEKMFNEVPLGD